MKLQPIEYRKIESVFLDIVEDCGFTRFPISPFEFARRTGVEIVSYSELPQAHAAYLAERFEDGFSAMVGEDGYCIYYNDLDFLPETRMRFTLWYELGHICLGHHDGTSATTDARKQQAECNYFARFAQAPMSFVIMVNPESPSDIARWFGVSWQCACYVYDKYLNVLRYRATAKALLNSRITRILAFDVWEIWSVS